MWFGFQRPVGAAQRWCHLPDGRNGVKAVAVTQTHSVYFWSLMCLRWLVVIIDDFNDWLIDWWTTLGKTLKTDSTNRQSHNPKSGRPNRLLLWAQEEWHCNCRNHHSFASGGFWKWANQNVRNIISSGRTGFAKQTVSVRQALVHRFRSTDADWRRRSLHCRQPGSKAIPQTLHGWSFCVYPS